MCDFIILFREVFETMFAGQIEGAGEISKECPIFIFIASSALPLKWVTLSTFSHFLHSANISTKTVDIIAESYPWNLEGITSITLAF
jgi:hypothetical protein